MSNEIQDLLVQQAKVISRLSAMNAHLRERNKDQANEIQLRLAEERRLCFMLDRHERANKDLLSHLKESSSTVENTIGVPIGHPEFIDRLEEKICESWKDNEGIDTFGPGEDKEYNLDEKLLKDNITTFEEREVKRERQLDIRNQAIAAVVAERERQIEQWGDQKRSWPMWFCIIGEEMGEVARQIVDHGCRNPVKVGMSQSGEKLYRPANDEEQKQRLRDLRAELVQLCATALQVIEFYDKQDTP